MSNRCKSSSYSLTAIVTIILLFKNLISESGFCSEVNGTPVIKSKPKLIIYLHFQYLIYSYISNLQAHSVLLKLFSVLTHNYLSFSFSVKVIKDHPKTDPDDPRSS